MSAVSDLSSFPPLDTGSPTRFPADRYPIAAAYFDAYSEEMARAAKSIDPAALDRAAEVLVTAYERRGYVFSCGNGGSAAIANHLQCDHVKAVGTATDLAPRVLSLAANVEILTAIANDIAYEDVFAHQLRAQAAPGDVLIAISSSGRSANIVNALKWARQHGVTTIALTGFGGGRAREIAEVAVHVDAANYGIVEDMHQAIMHALAQFIRQSRMTTDAIAAHVF
ncbi:MAG TPA: SIS domain-containing protein [Streptosporangiaceae bacterium]|nr:SIS domain-containing protein [Streptosporangiaceae bacterium]